MLVGGGNREGVNDPLAKLPFFLFEGIGRGFALFSRWSTNDFLVLLQWSALQLSLTDKINIVDIQKQL